MNFENLKDDMFQEMSLEEMSVIQGGAVDGTNCCCVSSTATGSQCSSDSCTDCGDIDEAAPLEAVA
jgi:hypothetical protein